MLFVKPTRRSRASGTRGSPAECDASAASGNARAPGRQLSSVLSSSTSPRTTASASSRPVTVLVTDPSSKTASGATGPALATSTAPSRRRAMTMPAGGFGARSAASSARSPAGVGAGSGNQVAGERQQDPGDRHRRPPRARPPASAKKRAHLAGRLRLARRGIRLGRTAGPQASGAARARSAASRRATAVHLEQRARRARAPRASRPGPRARPTARIATTTPAKASPDRRSIARCARACAGR